MWNEADGDARVAEANNGERLQEGRQHQEQRQQPPAPIASRIQHGAQQFVCSATERPIHQLVDTSTRGRDAAGCLSRRHDAD